MHRTDDADPSYGTSWRQADEFYDGEVKFTRAFMRRTEAAAQHHHHTTTTRDRISVYLKLCSVWRRLKKELRKSILLVPPLE